MDELMISGRRFISSLRAAKEHGYHSDYIGQLIRKGSVKGQKVGRAWYVDAGSLAAYLGKSDTTKISDTEMSSSSESPAQQADPGHADVSAETSLEFVSSPPDKLTTASAVFPLQKEEADFLASIERPEIAGVSVDVTTSTEKSKEHHDVPVKVAPPPKKYSGLVYLSDEAPLLPEIHKSAVTYREFEMTQSTNFTGIPHELSVVKRDYLLRGILLAVVALVTFIAVAIASNFFVYTLSSGPDGAASIQFAFPR